MRPLVLLLSACALCAACSSDVTQPGAQDRGLSEQTPPALTDAQRSSLRISLLDARDRSLPSLAATGVDTGRLAEGLSALIAVLDRPDSDLRAALASAQSELDAARAKQSPESTNDIASIALVLEDFEAIRNGSVRLMPSADVAKAAKD